MSRARLARVSSSFARLVLPTSARARMPRTHAWIESAARARRAASPSLVAVAAALVAYAMPAFALVVGLVGAVAVCTLSFALPPLVHLLLAKRNGLPILEDVILLVAGVLLGVITTTLTARTTAAALAEAYADAADFLS